MNKFRLSLALLLFFICCFAKFSQAQEREKVLMSFFSQIDQNGGISGSVFVAEKGGVLYQQSFGYADVEHKIPNAANTVFQIASVSKSFTAIAVLQLYERKKLNLTDKFSMYFPDFPYPEVTIRQMLMHTSGIPDVGDLFVPFWRLNRDTVFTLNDVIPALKISKVPLDFPAGTNWNYSNTNYNLLALLVEKLSGEKFDSYLSKNIFKPAGMKATFVKTPGSNPYNHPNVAYNYAFPFRLSVTPARVDSFAVNDYKVHYKTWPNEGAADIYTNVPDLVSFYSALDKGRLLKQSSLNIAFTPIARDNGRKITLQGVESESGTIGDFHYGFSNYIAVDTTMGKVVWESGGMPGCSANVVINFTKHQLLIWLDNRQSLAAMNNIFGALNIINDKPATVKKGKKHVADQYGQASLRYGPDRAFAELAEMRSDTVNYILDEGEFNQLGYEFFQNKKTDLALESFRTALCLFPNSDNLFNSYAELLAKSGKKEEAIAMYRKSLLLNPKNEDSRKSLELLEQK